MKNKLNNPQQKKENKRLKKEAQKKIAQKSGNDHYRYYPFLPRYLKENPLWLDYLAMCATRKPRTPLEISPAKQTPLGSFLLLLLSIDTALGPAKQTLVNNLPSVDPYNNEPSENPDMVIKEPAVENSLTQTKTSDSYVKVSLTGDSRPLEKKQKQGTVIPTKKDSTVPLSTPSQDVPQKKAPLENQKKKNPIKPSDLELEKLIEKTSIENQRQANYLDGFIKSTLKTLAKSDPLAIKIVLSSENFKICIKKHTSSSASMDYQPSTNNINIYDGFPPETGLNVPFFQRIFSSKLMHEIYHALVGKTVKRISRGTGLSIDEMLIEQARKDFLEAADTAQLILDPQQKKWFLFTKNLDGIISSEINISDLSTVMIKKEEEKLKTSSTLVHMDLEKLQNLLRNKTIDDIVSQKLAPFITEAIGNNSPFFPPFSIDKNRPIEQQIIEFNKEAYKTLIALTEKLSPEQKNTINTYYKRMPVSGLGPPGATIELEKIQKSGFSAVHRPGTKDESTVIYFYKDIDEKTRTLEIMGKHDQDKITAFQKWLKYRIERIWNYKKPALISQELKGFFGELASINGDLPKKLFPPLWVKLNEHMEEYLKSEKGLKFTTLTKETETTPSVTKNPNSFYGEKKKGSETKTDSKSSVSNENNVLIKNVPLKQ